MNHCKMIISPSDLQCSEGKLPSAIFKCKTEEKAAFCYAGRAILVADSSIAESSLGVLWLHPLPFTELYFLPLSISFFPRRNDPAAIIAQAAVNIKWGDRSDMGARIMPLPRPLSGLGERRPSHCSYPLKSEQGLSANN